MELQEKLFLAQGVLRGWLIERFAIEQAATHNYLLLTEDQVSSRRVAPLLVVAEQWGWLRPGAETVAQKVQNAELDLMCAVGAGKFPDLLMMARTTSVEYHFDRNLVEELAAKIGHKLKFDFDPWEVESKNTEPGTDVISTSIMTLEKCRAMHPKDLGLPDTTALEVVERYRGVLWAHRTDVVIFLKGCGIAGKLLPPAWQTHTNRQNGVSGSKDAPRAAAEPTTAEGSKWSKWITVQNSAWVPPASLDLAWLNFEKDPVIWLSRVVDFMAFGNERASDAHLETAARRCQASRVLCEAARKDLVKMIGCPDQPGDASEPIPRGYFDIPRQIGAANNSLIVFSDPILDEDFFPIDTGTGYQKWFNVRVEASSLVGWLRKIATPTDEPSEQPTRNEVLEEAAKRLEGRSTNKTYKKALNAGAKIIREMKSDEPRS